MSTSSLKIFFKGGIQKKKNSNKKVRELKHASKKRENVLEF